jgi:hypothetical protein
LSYSAQVSEALASLRNANLTGWDREIFGELLQMSCEQSRLIALLSTKLRLTNQARDNSVVAKRARERTPLGGRRPWDVEEDGLDN